MTRLTSDLLAGIPTEPIPLRRFASAEEVSGLVAYLASDDASFVNGACIPIDGGFVIQ